MGYLILVLIICLLTGFLGRYVAKEKNRSSTEGFVFGFFFNLLGVIIVALLPTKEKSLEVDENESKFGTLFAYILIFVLVLIILGYLVEIMN